MNQALVLALWYKADVIPATNLSFVERLFLSEVILYRKSIQWHFVGRFVLFQSVLYSVLEYSYIGIINAPLLGDFFVVDVCTIQ